MKNPLSMSPHLVGRAFLATGLLMMLPGGLQSQSTRSDAPQISPALRANLAKLLDVMGGRTIIVQVLDMQINAIKPSLSANPHLTTEFAEEFINQFRQRFLTSGEAEIAIENIYANYFTPAEVDQLTSATPGQETPLAQKVNAVQPKLAQDATQALKKFGPQIASEIGKSISEQHPEFLRSTATPAEPVQVRQEWVSKNLIKRVEPEYPSLAKAARIQGSVELIVTFAKDGSVRDIKLVRGHPMLVNSSRQAVAQWKVKPLRQNGEPVEVLAPVTVSFLP